MTLLWAMWNRREVSEEPGLRRITIKPDPIFIRARDGRFEHIEIIGEFEILQKLYFGGLPLTKISGFRDEISGNLILPGNTEIVTDLIDAVDVEANWQQIPSGDSLAVKPVMVLTTFDYYPSTVPGASGLPEGECGLT